VRWIRSWIWRIAAFARRSSGEREMSDELAFHIQSRADDLARPGLSPAEAERRARVEFGGVGFFPTSSAPDSRC
jgi:hypothetical protein